MNRIPASSSQVYDNAGPVTPMHHASVGNIFHSCNAGSAVPQLWHVPRLHERTIHIYSNCIPQLLYTHVQRCPQPVNKKSPIYIEKILTFQPKVRGIYKIHQVSFSVASFCGKHYTVVVPIRRVLFLVQQ